MSRLTHKYKYKADNKRFVFDMKDYRKVSQKLGKIEDILEKFGIDDLDTLEEILKVHKHLLDHDYSTLPKEDFDLLFEKVEQYKDIEKELGIDLATLYKCFKSTKFYVKNLFNEIIEVKSDIVRFDMGNGYVYFGADYCPLSSYGKTWALTREELEKKC